MKNLLNMMVITIAMMIAGAQMRVLVVTPTPEMHCNKCETKIKKHMMYEKGITKIETSVEKQTVTFTYDSRKTNKENIVKAMRVAGYECKIVKDEAVEKKTKKEKEKKK